MFALSVVLGCAYFLIIVFWCGDTGQLLEEILERLKVDEPTTKPRRGKDVPLFLARRTVNEYKVIVEHVFTYAGLASIVAVAVRSYPVLDSPDLVAAVSKVLGPETPCLLAGSVLLMGMVHWRSLGIKRWLG